MKCLAHKPGEPFDQVFFGGPDGSARALRDLLAARIKAVPRGGEIRWVTYYFRDEALAEALVSARGRGVSVSVTVEKKPRTAHGNQRVAGILQGSRGLADGFRQVAHRFPDNILLKPPRLHEKLYYFSHPHPHVLIGSFNPSTNRPEDPAVIAEIGDQDREHNFLVELKDPTIVSALKDHLQHLHTAAHGPWERLISPNNAVVRSRDTRLYLFPRRRRGVLKKCLRTLPADSILRVAASHFNNGEMANLLCRLRQKGVFIETIAHATRRRVPLWIERKLRRADITFHRCQHPEGTSTHNKFILIEMDGTKRVIFGSMNLSSRSLHANHEILVFSDNVDLFDQFRHRWTAMMTDIKDFENRKKA